eukprot:TRINITY_DN8669_c0_g1_i1.p1 TRINITY_DN8669_c0_g1~~TRINITY_DN8669_c0_g1_i1.p1  ORF type:complete len:121 (+),score=40.19 TRINITY_DN8669_c0_g1_i1:382-744(+)
MGDDGSVLEGMSSNFFVVRGGAVMTAQEGVLLGTVREVALQVCKKLPGGVEVVLEAPNVRDIGAWEGVFISSTSRLVLPVDELRYTGPEGDWVFHYNNPLVETIARGVAAEIGANSTKVL